LFKGNSQSLSIFNNFSKSRKTNGQAQNRRPDLNYGVNYSKKFLSSLIGACLFFLITNFGVWLLGSYEYTINGFILCFTLAIPFFAYSLISTLIFSGIIEIILKFDFLKIKI